MSVPVALIAAVGANNAIGADNALPWRLPSDFAFFKRTTMGKPLIMGRKTFESIGRPLPGRTNIVVSGRPEYSAEGVIVVPSLEDALALAQDVAARDGADEVMIGGGGRIYAQAISGADRLYITHVDASPAGDVVFPAIDEKEWVIVAQPDVSPDPRDTATYRIHVYERRESGRR